MRRASGGAGEARQRRAVERHGAALRLPRARQHAQQRRLSRSVRAEDADDARGGHGRGSRREGRASARRTRTRRQPPQHLVTAASRESPKVQREALAAPDAFAACVTAIGWENSGASTTAVWYSPRSPHGIDAALREDRLHLGGERPAEPRRVEPRLADGHDERPARRTRRTRRTARPSASPQSGSTAVTPASAQRCSAHSRCSG